MLDFAATNFVALLRACRASLGREGRNKVPRERPIKGPTEGLNDGPKEAQQGPDGDINGVGAPRVGDTGGTPLPSATNLRMRALAYVLFG